MISCYNVVDCGVCDCEGQQADLLSALCAHTFLSTSSTPVPFCLERGGGHAVPCGPLRCRARAHLSLAGQPLSPRLAWWGRCPSRFAKMANFEALNILTGAPSKETVNYLWCIFWKLMWCIVLSADLDLPLCDGQVGRLVREAFRHRIEGMPEGVVQLAATELGTTPAESAAVSHTATVPLPSTLLIRDFCRCIKLCSIW